MFSSADESLKEETRLLLIWVGSLVTLHTFVFTHITSVVKPVHIFMTGGRVSKSHLKAEISFHGYVHYIYPSLYIFSFHHKQCAIDYKDFTYMKFTTQLFSSFDESVKDETPLPLLWVGSIVTMYTILNARTFFFKTFYDFCPPKTSSSYDIYLWTSEISATSIVS